MCVYYYCWIDYYYSLIIVLFYSLGTRICKVCSNRNRECLVEECKDRRHSPSGECLYCLHHRDPKTRCRNCRTRGLVDGIWTKLCSPCLVEAEEIAKEKRLEREARKLEKDAIAKKKQLERKARKLEKEAI